MLKMTHLSKAYRTEVVETFALRDFSIHVREGEFVAVTGPSGSGKTTFLTIAGLLEEFSGGEYQLDGANVTAIGINQVGKVTIRTRQPIVVDLHERVPEGPLLRTWREARYTEPGYVLFFQGSKLAAQRFDTRSLRLTGEPHFLADPAAIGAESGGS
jgi:energy-coupling factor transporter ATP-binding protein EcfA2